MPLNNSPMEFRSHNKPHNIPRDKAATQVFKTSNLTICCARPETTADLSDACLAINTSLFFDRRLGIRMTCSLSCPTPDERVHRNARHSVVSFPYFDGDSYCSFASQSSSSLSAASGRRRQIPACSRQPRQVPRHILVCAFDDWLAA